jgi:hypothetical protein
MRRHVHDPQDIHHVAYHIPDDVNYRLTAGGTKDLFHDWIERIGETKDGEVRVRRGVNESMWSVWFQQRTEGVA